MKTKIKHLLSVLLCFAMLIGAMSSTALAASKTSGKCGNNVKWSYNKSNKTLTISGKGKMYDYYPAEGTPPPWQEYNGIKVVIKKGVTSIGINAFYGMKIEKVTFPDTLKQIDAAFVEAQLNCSVTIPKNVTKIESAFTCYGVKSFNVKKGNKKYSSYDGALFDKSKATLLVCPSGKRGSFNIPKGTKTIEESAFYGCKLKKLVIPASVKKISDYSFWDSEIKEVYFKGSAPKRLYYNDVFSFDSAVNTDIVYYPKVKESSWQETIDRSEYYDFGGKWKTWNP